MYCLNITNKLILGTVQPNGRVIVAHLKEANVRITTTGTKREHTVP
jgi:hypothetical protein